MKVKQVYFDNNETYLISMEEAIERLEGYWKKEEIEKFIVTRNPLRNVCQDARLRVERLFVNEFKQVIRIRDCCQFRHRHDQRCCCVFLNF